jgi:multidrug resistance protein
VTLEAVDKRRALRIVFLTILLDLLGFGLIIPIQPFYAEHFGARPAVITLLGAAYSLMQFVFSPFWGRLSDRYGRRPIMLSSVAFSVLGYGLFGAAGSLGMLFAARMLSGFGNANISTAQAIIADVTEPHERARGMGIIGAAFGLGFILGPALGGFLAQWGPSAPAFAASGLAAVNLVLAWFLLKETHNPNSGSTTRDLSFAALRRATERPGILGLMLVLFLLSSGFSMMEQIFALYIADVWVIPAAAPGTPSDVLHARGAALTSYLLVAIGITATVVQGGLIGRLTRQYGERRLLLVGLFTMALALASIPVAGAFFAYPSIFFTGFLMALGSGLSNPTSNSLLSRSTSLQMQGTVLGAGQAASALGRVFGPTLSGSLYQVAHIAPFLIGAVLLLLALAVALVALRRLHDEPGVSPPSFAH